MKHLFHPSDDALLTYNVDDNNKSIEPRYYVPVIPVLLVNGSTGLGTGYSSDVPGCDPLEVIKRIKVLLDAPDVEDCKLNPLVPWFRGFKESVV